jgi:hypothetical protein
MPDIRRQPQRGPVRAVAAWLFGLFGLLWRWIAGALLCTSYFTGVFVAGWVYRWMQGHVLHNWWRQSKYAQLGSFGAYCDSLGVNAPVPRPRWLLRERIGPSLQRPGRGGKPAGFMRKAWRWLTVPWHSLWLNFRTGVGAIFCTYLLTGWGCLLMYFGWVYGWLNSFHKGYEEAAMGATVSLLGIALFIAAMYYVLMAQVHQAVVGERMAFFDFKLVWTLIQTKPTAYCALLIAVTLMSIPLEILKVALLMPYTQGLPGSPVGDAGYEFFQTYVAFGNNDALTNAEVRDRLWQYTFWCCLFFFPLLLWLRRIASNIYSAAILKALRQGRITRAELPPRLLDWLSRLEILPTPVAGSVGVLKSAGRGIGWLYRRKIYVLLFLVLLVFVGKRYVGEFLNYHPGLGFLNHELVQLPAFDLVHGSAAATPAQ